MPALYGSQDGRRYSAADNFGMHGMDSGAAKIIALNLSSEQDAAGHSGFFR